jgi:hypothetical protein
MRISKLVMLAGVALAFVPASAHGQNYGPTEHDNYITGYYARNFGGELYEDRAATNAIGVALTFWGQGLLSAEADLSYSPTFLEKEDIGGRETKLVTATISGIVGPWFGDDMHRFRVYGVAGGGLLRTELIRFARVRRNPENRGVLDFGGGILYLANDRVGVRGDLRYLMGVGQKINDKWGILSRYNWWRGSIGLSLAF